MGKNSSTVDKVLRLRFPRHNNPLKHALSIAMSMLIWHYIFYWVVIATVVVGLVWTGLVSSTTVWLCVCAYVAQLIFHKPHLACGWPFWNRVLQWSLLDHGLNYLDAQIVREGTDKEIAELKQFVFAWFPHGILGVCRLATAGSAWNKMYPGVRGRWGSFGGAFYLPGVREWSLSVGALDASRAVMNKQLQRGDSIHLIPGGIQEMMLTNSFSNVTTLVLNERKGFVRLAVENGAALVPVFCFGEKWACRPLHLPDWMQEFLHQRLRISGTAPVGRFFTLLPNITKEDGSPLSIAWVFGKPIPVRKLPRTHADFNAVVDEAHAKLCDEVRDIFERYKQEFGYGKDETLELVEAKSRN